MRRHAWTAIRLVVATAGVAFILSTLTWDDHVRFPAGYEIGGRTLAEERTMAVADERGDRLVLEAGAFSEEGPTVLDRDGLGRMPDRPQLVPGVATTVSRVDYPLLALAFLAMGAAFPLQSWRWLMLMRCRAMGVGSWAAFRLTMAGVFFNLFMPGTTGGDVLKGYYAARNSGRRASAVMSVLIDRIVGLVGLVLLAALVGLTMLEHPWVGRITLGLWLGLLALASGTTLYLSRRWRRALRATGWIRRLPARGILVRIDRAATAYRDSSSTLLVGLLISLVVHLCLVTACALAGKALAIGHPFELLLGVVPLVILAGAVPITFQGLGVMEWLSLLMLHDSNQPDLATANQIVGMLLLFRFCMVCYALLGSLFILSGNIQLFPEGRGGAAALAGEAPASEPSAEGG